MKHLEIHSQLNALVQTERKITQQILDLINQCEQIRAYAKLGYSSMFEYLNKGLGYSEGSAQRRLSSARLLRDIPDIRTDLQSGVLNLTQVSMAQIAIRKEEKTQKQKMDSFEKKELINKLKSKNTFESKNILANELTSYSIDLVNDSAKPTKGNNVQITITLDQQQYLELKEAQDYLSNSVKSTELKDYLIYVTKKVLQKKNRTAVAAVDGANLAKKSNNDSAISGQRCNQINNSTSNKLRPYISQTIKKHVFQNANFQCQYVAKETRKRCEAKRHLQIDHIKPVALNGSSHLENLRIYCRAHNLASAMESGLLN
jgi:5-methylcytosine-specific restriction endonuclease McrA